MPKSVFQIELLKFMPFNAIVKASKLCRQFYMLVDSNRPLIVTDDNLNLTLIRRNKKFRPQDAEEVERKLSPHLSAILGIHDGWK